MLMLLAPPLATAQALRYLQVEQAAVVQAGEQAMFLATCPDDLRIVAGGYKLVASELPLRDVIMVESRPVPEQRQWAVTLLYEPPAGPAEPEAALSHFDLMQGLRHWPVPQAGFELPQQPLWRHF
jgi:hypothetical protein